MSLFDERITKTELVDRLEKLQQQLWSDFMDSSSIARDREKLDEMAKLRSALAETALRLSQVEDAIRKLSTDSGQGVSYEIIEEAIARKLKSLVLAHVGAVLDDISGEESCVRFDHGDDDGMTQGEFLNYLARLFMKIHGHYEAESDDVDLSTTSNPFGKGYYDLAYQAYCAFRGDTPEFDEPMGFHGFTDPKRQVKQGFHII